jgi:hypothetical protein
MRNARRFRPSPALVISLIALFVSVSGVAWAAATIGTSDIKNGAVTAKKLHKNSVTRKKVKNNAVNAAKIASEAVGADELGSVVVRTANISVPAGSARQVSRNCDPGELALSVGANWSGAATVGPVLQAATFLTGAGEPSGGTAAGRNDGGAARTLTVSVACLAP